MKLRSLVSLLFLLPMSVQSLDAETFPMLVGGYGEGLYRVDFDSSAEEFSEATLLHKLERASFFCLHPTRDDVVYSVCESDKAAAVVALRLSDDAQTAEVINQQLTEGKGACFVSTDAKGKFAFAANYGDGSISMFPIGDDGRLEPLCERRKHSGSSVHPKRQGEPHAHSCIVDPSDEWLLCPDLGIDKVVIYRIDRDGQKLKEDPRLHLIMPPGSGPRHLAFHPDGRTFYVINEIANTIAVVDWDAEAGKASIRQIVSTVPDGAGEGNTTAEIQVHPNGGIVFGSNRGHDSIVSYQAGEDHTLKLAGWCESGGKNPRNFRIDPTGDYVVSENQDSDSLILLKLDEKTGKLTATGAKTTVPKPACVKFLR